MIKWRYGACLVATTLVVEFGILVNLANASQDNVRFFGNVPLNNSCVVTVNGGAAYGQNATVTQLNSKLPGGHAGVAVVIGQAPLQIFVQTPDFFIVRPVGGDEGVTHVSSFSGTALDAAGINFPNQSGHIPMTLGPSVGRTEVKVDLEANRETAFPDGTYTSVATVRCE